MTKILVVDDEAPVRAMLALMLEQAGYEFELADGGEAGWAACDSDDPPDLVLLDIMMPDTDGAEVLRRIRAEQRLDRIPVVILTARTDLADRVALLESGADDYVTKPFAMDELRARITSALRFRFLAVSLAHSTEEAERLGCELILSEDRLRAEISDELHDEIMQGVVAARMLLETVSEAGDVSEGLRSRAVGVIASLDRAAAVSRALLRGLAPPLDAHGDLIDTLRDDLDVMAAGRGVSLAMHGASRVADLDEAVRTTIYHIVREAVANALRHAGASHVDVAIEDDPSHIQCTISDDGVGLRASSEELDAGYGMITMRLRAANVGATLSWDSVDGGGTVVTLVVPRTGPRADEGHSADDDDISES